MFFKDILEIIEEHTDTEKSEIKPETNFSDLGIDSLSLFELIMIIEDKFNVSITDEDSQNIKTVADLSYFIEKNKAR